jgi:hypothetical protein
VAIGDDRDRVRVVRVERLRNEERGEGDVLALAETVARDAREDVLAVRGAGDGYIALAEELDAHFAGHTAIVFPVEAPAGGSGKSTLDNYT